MTWVLQDLGRSMLILSWCFCYLAWKMRPECATDRKQWWRRSNKRANVLWAETWCLWYTRSFRFCSGLDSTWPPRLGRWRYLPRHLRFSHFCQIYQFSMRSQWNFYQIGRFSGSINFGYCYHYWRTWQKWNHWSFGPSLIFMIVQIGRSSTGSSRADYVWTAGSSGRCLGCSGFWRKRRYQCFEYDCRQRL